MVMMAVELLVCPMCRFALTARGRRLRAEKIVGRHVRSSARRRSSALAVIGNGRLSVDVPRPLFGRHDRTQEGR